MQYKKPFKTYSEQLQILIDRGLIVNSEDSAKFYLKKYNYYRFSAYCIPFQDVKDVFNNDVCFEDILKLYEFDSKIRLLLYEVLEEVEIQIRTLFAYYFGKKYGPWGYTEKSKFSEYFNHEKWFDNISNEVTRSKDEFILEYFEEYPRSPNLPIWMLTEVLSFGSLSLMYSGMKMSDQKALAADFGLKNAVVRSWLHHLSYVRNLCAHHSRVWNKSFAIKPIIPFGKSWEFLNHRNNKLFASFSILNHFIDEFSLEVDLLSKLNDLFDEYGKCFPFSLHVKMGFPEQYSDI